jgi:hypothetical protein
MELSINAVFFGFEAESVFLVCFYEVEEDYSMNPHPCPCVHPHPKNTAFIESSILFGSRSSDCSSCS